MLIPNYWSDVWRSRSRNSSLRPVYRAHRPIVKEKLRSYAPTVSSLLLSAFEYDQCLDTEITVTRSMESRVHKISEASMTEPLGQRYQTDGINPSCSTSCAMTRRTEDISIREDEDGVRSHLCPYDKIQDSDEEDDEAMKFDIDIDQLIKNFCLKSDEIPCLQGEKPPLTDSDETTSSDVDTSTAMIYAPMYNPSSIKGYDSLGYFSVHHIKTLQDRKLDENTIARWNDDLSDDDLNDDDEYYISNKRETERLLTIEDESDMEEFMETPEIKNVECGKLESSNQEGITGKIRYEKVMDWPERTDIYETGIIENSKLISDKNKRNKNHSSENNNEEFILKTNPSKKAEDSKEYIEANNDSNSLNNKKDFELPKSGSVTTLLDLKTEDRNSEEIRKLFDSMLDSVSKNEFTQNNVNLKSDINFSKASDFLKSENVATVLTDGNIASTEAVTEVVTKHDEESKPDDLGTNISIKEEDNNQEVSSNHHILLQTDSKTKENTDVKKNDLSEPTVSRMQKASKDEEIQPDLATALRFMTEVYHSKDDEELYSDTLNLTDVPIEDAISEKSGIAILSENSPSTHREETIDRPSSGIKPPTKSNVFEPVKTEEQRTVTRPRNKLSKFINSVKRKLAKKT